MGVNEAGCAGARDLSTQSPAELEQLVHQAIPLRVDGRQHTVQVFAQPTQCPQLVITPAVESSPDRRRLRFRGALALTHTRTGALLAENADAERLEMLAVALKDFDWSFDELNHFTAAENAEVTNAVREVIRSWQMDEAYSGSVTLWGEDADKRAAREREPATTLLREQLDWWPAHFKSILGPDSIKANADAWREAISCSVQGWGMAYLLAVLQRVDPTVADVAARQLVAEFDAGDGLGEWVFQWSQELAASKPLTLPGIPDADPLTRFGADT